MDKGSQLDWILAMLLVAQEDPYMKKQKAKAKIRAYIAEVVNECLPERQELDTAKEIEKFRESIGDLHPNSKEYQSMKVARSLAFGNKAGSNYAIEQLLVNLEKKLETI